MKIVFMGTPEFAVPSLKILIENGFDVAAVVTQPDRAKGRGNKLTPPPVKMLAQEHGIRVYQPEKIREQGFIEVLRDIGPDLIVVVAFGQILPQAILELPAHGCINVHASMLPRYRGAAPINWCIINGDKKTGVTTMFMDKGLDTGDMILRRETEIGAAETAQELHDRLSVLGAGLLLETLELLETGKAPRAPQDGSKATYAPIMTKNLGKVDWTKTAEAVHNLVRGTYPWPGAFSAYRGRTFKILGAEVSTPAEGECAPGTISGVGRDSFTVCCGSGSLRVTEVQFENEKRMSVEAYLRGHTIAKGEKLV